MASTPHGGTGTVFKFATNEYTVTNITYSLTDTGANDTIDISHLALTTGAALLTQDRPLKGAAGDTGREITMDYIGSSVIADGATGEIVITGGLTLTKNATVSASSVTLAVNDVIRGSATFRVAR
jgi:hypothetical protein